MFLLSLLAVGSQLKGRLGKVPQSTYIIPVGSSCCCHSWSVVPDSEPMGSGSDSLEKEMAIWFEDAQLRILWTVSLTGCNPWGHRQWCIVLMCWNLAWELQPADPREWASAFYAGVMWFQKVASLPVFCFMCHIFLDALLSTLKTSQYFFWPGHDMFGQVALCFTEVHGHIQGWGIPIDHLCLGCGW